MKIFLVVISSFIFTQAFAATVAVVDSGFDKDHALLIGKTWSNPNEKLGNRIDDDQNGFVDDFFGWNFAEDSSDLFEISHSEVMTPTMYKLFEVIARIQLNTATDEDQEFLDKEIVNLPDEKKKEVLSVLMFFGQYSHGTHVAGIVSQYSPSAQLMNMKTFPDQPPGVLHGRGLLESALGWGSKALAAVTNQSFSRMASYAGSFDADVINMSLGVQIEGFAKIILNIQGNKEPSEEEVGKLADIIYTEFQVEGDKWVKAAPNSLFVVAAGNSGTNNDIVPAFPANLELDNLISVAATNPDGSLADFSNYGEKTVDIAAPGVAIVSSVPDVNHKAQLPMSGTSMAAPIVSAIAAEVKDANPELSPLQIKGILMGTTDIHPTLEGKVVSGLLNSERAVYAAKLSKEKSLEEVIALSYKEYPKKSFSSTTLPSNRFGNYRELLLVF